MAETKPSQHNDSIRKAESEAEGLAKGLRGLHSASCDNYCAAYDPVDLVI